MNADDPFSPRSPSTASTHGLPPPFNVQEAPFHPTLEDEVLRTIVEGVETKAEEEFYISLVKHLSSALKVKYAYLSEFREEEECFWSCAGWGPTGPLPLFQVPSGGPCEAVLQRQTIFHQGNLPSLYPKNQMIRDWNAQSYCGIPILDSLGHVAGHLAVLDDKPLREGEYVTSILRIFRVKAQAETERRQLFQALRKK